MEILMPNISTTKKEYEEYNAKGLYKRSDYGEIYRYYFNNCLTEKNEVIKEKLLNKKIIKRFYELRRESWCMIGGKLPRLPFTVVLIPDDVKEWDLIYYHKRPHLIYMYKGKVNILQSNNTAKLFRAIQRGKANYI